MTATGAAPSLADLQAAVAARDCVLVPGLHAIKHAHRFGAEVLAVLALDPDGARELAADLAPDLVPRLAAAVQVDRPEMKAFAGDVHPTGVVAVATRPDASGPVRGPGVVLEDPRHLGNVGASIRVAAGLGARSVSTTGSADVWSPAAVRGSAGLHWAVAVHGGTSAAELAEPGGGPIVGLDPGGRPIGDAEVPPEALLLFGTERDGLTAAARRACDELVRIPMRDGVSSLNLATSVAIGLYHLLRVQPAA